MKDGSLDCRGRADRPSFVGARMTAPADLDRIKAMIETLRTTQRAAKLVHLKRADRYLAADMLTALVAEVERLRLARDADRLWLEAKALSAQADAEEWARKCAVADDEVERLRARMAKLEGALRDCREHFDGIASAGYPMPAEQSDYARQHVERIDAALNPEKNDV